MPHIVRRLTVASCLVWASPGTLRAQTEYHDLESGRPTRIEDASVTPRHAIEWEMAPIQVQDFGDGLVRWQIEPALAYGILPRTDVEFTAPFIFRERGATPRHGLTGFSLGAMYNFNTESTLLPALAVKGDVLFPAAGATTSGTLYAFRALATRTFGRTRLHLNVEYSSFHVATTPAAPTGCTTNCPPVPPPIPDVPCGITAGDPAVTEAALVAATDSMAAARATARRQTGGSSGGSSAAPTQTGGNLWLAGLAADHALPLWSLLIVSDVYVVRYTGDLPRPSDWTGELGIRKQITPRLVLDAGIGRLFMGLRPAWTVTFGTTYTFALSALVPEARPGAPHL